MGFQTTVGYAFASYGYDQFGKRPPVASKHRWSDIVTGLIVTNLPDKLIFPRHLTLISEISKTLRMDDNLAAISVPRVDPTDKIMVFSILTIFILLAALTSALPSPDPLDQSGVLTVIIPNNGDAAWVLTASAMVLLMTPGVSFFYGGMVDHKNIISTMYQRLVKSPEYHPLCQIAPYHRTH